MENEIIKLENVSIGYGKTAIVENISLSIYENDFIGIVGPNGAGKTTLLKTLLGNLKPLRGIISPAGSQPFRLCTAEGYRPATAALYSAGCCNDGKVFPDGCFPQTLRGKIMQPLA